jgi:hypothetical protein
MKDDYLALQEFLVATYGSMCARKLMKKALKDADFMKELKEKYEALK